MAADGAGRKGCQSKTSLRKENKLKKSNKKKLADADGFAEASTGAGREDCHARPPPTRLSSCWRGFFSSAFNIFFVGLFLVSFVLKLLARLFLGLVG